MFFAYIKLFLNKFISMLLSNLPIGETAKIKRVFAGESAKRRMDELGLVEGFNAVVVRFAPFFDPIEIKVGSVYLAIRKSDAEKIEVEKVY